MKRYNPRPQITKGQRFFIFDDPDLQGVVVQAGPEQSEIKFDNGNVRNVPNHWLTPIVFDEDDDD